jgi:hypothetical protein
MRVAKPCHVRSASAHKNLCDDTLSVVAILPPALLPNHRKKTTTCSLMLQLTRMYYRSKIICSPLSTYVLRTWYRDSLLLSYAYSSCTWYPRVHTRYCLYCTKTTPLLYVRIYLVRMMPVLSGARYDIYRQHQSEVTIYTCNSWYETQSYRYYTAERWEVLLSNIQCGPSIHVPQCTRYILHEVQTSSFRTRTCHLPPATCHLPPATCPCLLVLVLVLVLVHVQATNQPYLVIIFILIHSNF